MDIKLPCTLVGHLTREEVHLALVDRGLEYEKVRYVLKLCRLRHDVDRGRLITEVHFRPNWYARVLRICISGQRTLSHTRKSELFQNLRRLVTQRKELSFLQLYQDIYWLREGRFCSTKMAQIKEE